MHWETRKFPSLLNCDSHSVGVVWNQTHHISAGLPILELDTK